MAKIRRIVLDVLKPHQPNVVDFAISLAELADRCHVKIIVTEVDKKTENIILELTGDDVLFQMINEEIKKMGASVHSIDEVEVEGRATDEG